MGTLLLIVGVAAFSLLVVVLILERISMDTTALKDNFNAFKVSFDKFAEDFAVFLAKQPQDTPEQIADVKAVTDGLAAFKTQADALDAALNPTV